MDTTHSSTTQPPAQDVVAPAWFGMASAPAGDATACIDIWCAEDGCRRTDCFWEQGRWLYETFENGDYRAVAVKRPHAWMPAPGIPEGV